MHIYTHHYPHSFTHNHTYGQCIKSTRSGLVRQTGIVANRTPHKPRHKQTSKTRTTLHACTRAHIYIHIYTCVYTHFYIVIRRSSRLVRGWCDKVRGRRLTTFHSTCVAPFHYAAQGPMTCTRYAADARTTQASNKVKNTKTNTNPPFFCCLKHNCNKHLRANLHTHLHT